MEQPRFDGLLNLYKPTGISSARALYRVRAITRIRKSGHAGTLDPAAEGVLLLCMGRATKRVEALMNLPKIYRARARLDVTSPSFDADGPLQPVAVERPPSLPELQHAASELTGEIDQLPPAFSAVKVGGVRAYTLARRKREVAVKPRKVRVYRMHIDHYDWPELTFEVTCGRGTYIRALIRDLAHKVGSGGCLTSLVRSAVGPFTAAEATALDELDPELFERRRVSLQRLDELLCAEAAGRGMPQAGEPGGPAGP